MVDHGWFMDRIKLSRYKSQRGLAKALKLNQANLSRLLTGVRPMRLQEAEDLSRLLDIPLTEVLSHSGLKSNDLDTEDLIRALEYYGSGGSDAGKRARHVLSTWRK